MNKIIYSALLLYSISTQNFASEPNQLQQIQSDMQEIKKMNSEISEVNQLFNHCKMELSCIQTGLNLLADQRNQVAISMLDELQKKQSASETDLKNCYQKEKITVNDAFAHCKAQQSNLNKPQQLNQCTIKQLGSLGLKGNLLAQMLLLQGLKAQNKLDEYKDWQGKFSAIRRDSKCE